MKLTRKQYEFCCELIWGCIPIDRVWAEEMPIFKTRAPELLEKYPKLDESFLNN